MWGGKGGGPVTLGTPPPPPPPHWIRPFITLSSVPKAHCLILLVSFFDFQRTTVANQPAFCRILLLFCLKYPAVLQIVLNVLQNLCLAFDIKYSVKILVRGVGPMIFEVCFEKTVGCPAKMRKILQKIRKFSLSCNFHCYPKLET